MALTVLRAAGSSTSGTDGTVVAAIEAASGKRIVGWTCFAGQANAAGTKLGVKVTYTDDTSTEMQTSAATGAWVVANPGGVMRFEAGSFASAAQWQAKDIKRVEVLTRDTGTGTRYADIGGIEADSSDTLRSAGATGTGNSGTIVADIQASSGNEIVFWTAFTGQTSAANTQTRIIITYSDQATTTVDTSAGTLQKLLVNAGGVLTVLTTAGVSLTQLADKPVVRIQVQTLGTGTGWRAAVLGGEQAPIDTYGRVRAAGTSTASSGATVASVATPGGQPLIGWSAFGTQTQTANTSHTVLVTYLDDTTTSASTGTNTAASQLANPGGALRIVTNAVNQQIAWTSPDIKAVAVLTAGNSNSGTRYGVIAGYYETSQGVTPPLLDQAGTVYAPTVTPGQVTVSPSLISQAGTVYAPVVSAGSVTISPSRIEQAGATLAPDLIPGGLVLSPGLITQDGTVFEPSLSVPGAGAMLPGLLAQDGLTFAPNVQMTVSLELIEQIATVFACAALSQRAGVARPWTHALSVAHASELMLSKGSALDSPLQTVRSHDELAV